MTVFAKHQERAILTTCQDIPPQQPGAAWWATPQRPYPFRGYITWVGFLYSAATIYNMA